VIVDVLVTVWKDVKVSVDVAAVTVRKLPTVRVVTRVAAAFVTVVLGFTTTVRPIVLVVDAR